MHPVWAELAEEKARIVRVARLRAVPQAPPPAYAEARALLAGLRGAARKKVALEVLEVMRGRSWGLVRARPLGFAPAALSEDVGLVKEGQVLQLDEVLELCARQWSDIFVYLVHESRKLAPADESDVTVRASELAVMLPDHGRSAGGGSKHKRGRSAEDDGSESDSGGSSGGGRSAGDVSSASSRGTRGGSGSDSDEAALLPPALFAEQIVEIGPACLEAIDARAAVARARGEQAKAKATAAAEVSERFVKQLMRTALGLPAGAAGRPPGLDAVARPPGLDATATAMAAASSFADASATAMAAASSFADAANRLPGLIERSVIKGLKQVLDSLRSEVAALRKSLRPSNFADAADRLPGLIDKSVTKGLKEQQQELDSLRSELAALSKSVRPSRTRSGAKDHGRGSSGGRGGRGGGGHDEDHDEGHAEGEHAQEEQGRAPGHKSKLATTAPGAKDHGRGSSGGRGGGHDEDHDEGHAEGHAAAADDDDDEAAAEEEEGSDEHAQEEQGRAPGHKSKLATTAPGAKDHGRGGSGGRGGGHDEDHDEGHAEGHAAADDDDDDEAAAEEEEGSDEHAQEEQGRAPGHTSTRATAAPRRGSKKARTADESESGGDEEQSS
jgi:hypothetical protein